MESDSVASDHLRGWWCPVDRTEELLPDADSYVLLTRRDWFAPMDARWDAATPWSRDQVCAWSSEAARDWPGGVARSYVVAGLDSGGQELHRGFLVSLGWPGHGANGTAAHTRSSSRSRGSKSGQLR